MYKPTNLSIPTDIGRFADNFSLGFQFNAEAESGLLFYVYSRRREDKMAIQLNDSTVCMSTLHFVMHYTGTCINYGVLF